MQVRGSLDPILQRYRRGLGTKRDEERENNALKTMLLPIGGMFSSLDKQTVQVEVRQGSGSGSKLNQQNRCGWSPPIPTVLWSSVLQKLLARNIMDACSTSHTFFHCCLGKANGKVIPLGLCWGFGCGTPSLCANIMCWRY
jgi:hypothetical protein